MAPMSAQEELGEASESRSSRARRRRRRSPTRHRSPAATAAPSGAPSESEPSSHRRKRKRSRAAKERSRRRKRARAADKSRQEVQEEEAAAAASASAATEQAASSDASSTVSSPARRPCLPSIVLPFGGEMLVDVGPEVEAAYDEELEKYLAKKKRDHSLPTLDETISPTCMHMNELLPVRESATKTVLQAAKFVVGLSSHIDGKLLARSSGFFIDWNERTRCGTLLTSAHIICTKHTPGIREYASDSQVTVHLNRKTSVDACLLHYDMHYNLAVFECHMDLSPQLPCLSDEVTYAQDIFVLGRNERLNLDISYGKVQWFENHHHMYVGCKVAECDSGGPLINFDGGVVGMVDPIVPTAFIPVSVILRCLRLQKKFNCIPRLLLGLKLSAIKFLDPSHIELISDSYGITAGLIVKKVAVGSIAEKVGIRIGDIIECWNGERISTTAKLDDMLLRICEEHFDKGNGLGSSVQLTVEVFRVRKENRCTKMLTLIASDELESFVEEDSRMQHASQCTYMVSAKEGAR
ncbi:hypothetical protein ACP70R_039595 [Stipagrostis hirtigluma subsp. patula]